MRKLASIKRIDAILPIEGADAIELAVLGGWQSVVKKGEYLPGDLAVYCEVDSLLPIRPEYEFLRKSSYKKMWDGTEGFRLKTIRLRGQLSQGLLLPVEEVFKALGDFVDIYEEYTQEPLCFEEGDDVTDILGIVKWDTSPPGVYQGQGKGSLPMNAKGPFPSWLPKTDEERIQNCWNMLPKGVDYVETEKLHGTSATFYLKDGEFGVCSRNLDLKIKEGGLYAEVANELEIERKMRYALRSMEAVLDEPAGFGFAIQGEIIGEGINGNYYNIERRRFYVFNVFSEGKNGYLSHGEAKEFAEFIGFDFVPVINEHYRLPATCAEALAAAEGPATVGKQPVREGSVIRHSLPHGRRISCKIISNAYLLKEK